MNLPWFPAQVRAIFFDAVGTLIHPEPPAGAVYTAVGRLFGSRLDEATVTGRFHAAFAHQEELDERQELRTDEARELQRWQAIVGDVLNEVLDLQGCFQALFEYFARPESWQCDPDAADTLGKLARRGYQLGICSNFDSRLRTVLAGLPGLQGLQPIIISSEIGWRKPAQAFFDRLAESVALSPHQILMVGDDLRNDYHGARWAGLNAVLLDRKQKQRAETINRITRLGELLDADPNA